MEKFEHSSFILHPSSFRGSLKTSEDSQDLAAFGYKPALDRTLGSFSSFAAGFSYISILTGVFQMFYVGYGAGGPAFFWTWPAVFLGQLTVGFCFAELSAQYPLSGGIYQWSRRTGGRAVGWMAGWVYLCGSVISLSAVALAPQATLPQISPAFHLIGDPSKKSDNARNAVILGCVLIAATTAINVAGVRLMARINNVGVIAELVGVVLLIGLLAVRAVRGPTVLFDTQGRGAGQPMGYLGPFLAAALMASYVLYGFDTAGTLAEETAQPRRRAPRAILQALGAAAVIGAFLILFSILAVSDPTLPELGRINGGLSYLVKDVLGSGLGTLFLADVILAIFVCALAVHAGTVRLVFAMARDNNLPFARSLGHVPERTHAPVLPPLLIGGLAATLLILNINLPQVIETLCAVAIVWVNLAYLMVTLPMLVTRFRRRGPRATRRTAAQAEAGADGQPLFSMGRLGLTVNAIAVVWGVFIVLNISWPRTEIYGQDPWGRYAAPLATLALLVVGAVYYQLVQRKKTGILVEHAYSVVNG
jgi:urea carboxylase system permease